MSLRKRILFVETAHSTEDDRVFYHQVPALQREGFEVDVVSTLGLSGQPKKDAIESKIKEFRPDFLICDTPFAVLTSKKHSKGLIIYDVTEFYPSKKNLRCNFFVRPFRAAVLHRVNQQACKAADAFIFGEPEKAAPIQKKHGSKPSVLLPYFPREEYVPYCENTRDIKKEIRLFYAGPLTKEKGYPDVIEIAKNVALMNPETKVILTVVSAIDAVEECSLPHNLHIDHNTYMPFRKFCQLLSEQDIYLDLRENDAENTRCLPIKLFYYMAAGRPMIYSNLKAISEFVEHAEEFVTLVNPEKHEEAAKAISTYIRQPDSYQKACSSARAHYLEAYTWEMIEPRFIQFIDGLTR